jgi:hypothetical protein
MLRLEEPPVYPKAAAGPSSNGGGDSDNIDTKEDLCIQQLIMAMTK